MVHSSAHIRANLLHVAALLTCCVVVVILANRESWFAAPQLLPTISQGAQLFLPHPKRGDQPSFDYLLGSSETRPSVYLSNSQGRVVHSWNTFATRARMLDQKRLLVALGGVSARSLPGYFALSNRVRELSWDGRIVWEYAAPGPAHHDVRRLPNGNTILLYRELVPEEILRKVSDRARRESRLSSDRIVEVTPDGAEVFSWSFVEHFDINQCGDRPCESHGGDRRALSRARDWTHVNTVYPLKDNKWFREGDTRFRPGNLMLTVRNWSMVIIIDRESGLPVWQNSGSYKGGFSFPHDAQLIPDGFPGAGNLLIVDNGGGQTHHGETYIVEMNPVSEEVVWTFDKGKRFFVPASGATKRLKNGNTWISSGRLRRFMEIAPSGEIVWEASSTEQVRRVIPLSEEDMVLRAL